MATKSGRNNAPVRKNTSTKSRSKSRNTKAQQERMDAKVREEVTFLSSLALAILLFLCNFHIIGAVGDHVSHFMFGLFGWMAYIAPILLFFAICFGVINLGNRIATIKLSASILAFFVVEIFSALIAGLDKAGSSFTQYYQFCADGSKGGGLFGTLLAKFLHTYLGSVGAVIVCIILFIICFVVISEKSFVDGMKEHTVRFYDNAKSDVRRRIEINENRRLEREERLITEEDDNAARKVKRRADKLVSGVMLDTDLSKNAEDKQVTSTANKTSNKTKKVSSDLHQMSDPFDQIRISGVGFEPQISEEPVEITPIKTEVRSHSIKSSEEKISSTESDSNSLEDELSDLIATETLQQLNKRDEAINPMPLQASIQNNSIAQTNGATKKPRAHLSEEELNVSEDLNKAVKPFKNYKLPPLNLLGVANKSVSKNDYATELKETAYKLEETLKTFGVKVTVTDISRGPSVTRYELQPEVGVKVSKIVNLADDIKLNLAATDIRIEAPIPGKSAIGIEVPNKENSAVALGDLFRSKEFKEFPSKIAFAVGKDIAGQTIVTDIAKMPHLLIAGSTGSGKSVCINTLIMSILYKAKPDEVKLILIDPKVVELSVYNGIPHLLLPVVTDPKKAAAALNWGVAEMSDRYQKFSELGVRDLKNYNAKVEQMESNDGKELPAKMEQIVIIVDELADLMMVASKEVEESICRLAQLARAAGIHLVIATQRPSVDVITGLIKANMPSRVAFAVSSGVDSRTILDVTGAEKLLGKGDMLFNPQGYPKPARMQGAFVSDEEVASVVDYIKSQCDGEVTYSEEIADKMLSASSGNNALGDSNSDRDEYFEQAGKFIIEKNKASIGMLQRVFKIGFNRAARIMDQLCDLGVVGEEEGTKPRKVLMTMEEFEQLIDELS